MNLSLFLARRMNGSGDNAERISKPAVRIATLGVAIGVLVMVLAVAIVVGFKKEIRNKITGFGAHIQISDYSSGQSLQQSPIVCSDSMRHALSLQPGVQHIQRYSTTAGIIMAGEAFQGTVLKGLAQEYDTTFLHNCLVGGRLPIFSDSIAGNELLVSKTIADKLHLKVGDRVFTYFISNKVRARRFTVTGIYRTNFSEFDNLLLLTDLYTVNRLNQWNTDQVTGIEIAVTDYDFLTPITANLAYNLDRKQDGRGGVYRVLNVEQLNPSLFAWLGLLDMNVWVIFILMLGIAGFTMISGLLIIILERTRMIGILKALGAPNHVIRKTFLYLSLFLVGKGILFGNIVALALYFIQLYWAPFKLDQDTYYIDHVPVSMNWWLYLALNVATFLISMFMLIGPSYLISKISPVKSIRYE